MKNKESKEIITELHKETILSSSEKLFLEKGFDKTTITDISKSSEYSRRTIYSYFNSKKEILNHIVLKGLKNLLQNITLAIESNADYIEKYELICKAMENYYLNSPYSFEMVNRLKNKNMNIKSQSKTVVNIFYIGSEINNLLEDYIDDGKKNGIILPYIKTKETVYIIWSNISSLLSLVDNKGQFIEKDTKNTKEEFLNYGYKQIINSIIKERIK